MKTDDGQQTIHLQGLGLVPAKPAGELKPGDWIMWNQGYKNEVQAVEDLSPVSVYVSLGQTYDGDQIYGHHETLKKRRFSKTRLVAIAQPPATATQTESRESVRQFVHRLLENDGEPQKHASTTQPGLFFWAEHDPRFRSWTVMAQAEGAPKTEAWDDQFAKFEDADEIAQMLARGEDPGEVPDDGDY